MFQLVLYLALRMTSQHADFSHDVRPILEQRCTPCHFSSGKMYDRLPFDRAETIVKLGEKKVFTRIKDERERAIIRAFLSGR
jgi:hypothetical protein